MSCLKPPQVAEHLSFFLTKRSDVPRDATADDRSNLDECEGYVSKLSQRGAWQSRFFYLNNAFLVYTSKKGAPPLVHTYMTWPAALSSAPTQAARLMFMSPA